MYSAFHHDGAAYRRRGSFLDGGPRIVERSRGTAHPKVPAIRPNRVAARRSAGEAAFS